MSNQLLCEEKTLPMGMLLRTVFLAIIAIAVSVQGVAAASMTMCHPDHRTEQRADGDRVRNTNLRDEQQLPEYVAASDARRAVVKRSLAPDEHDSASAQVPESRVAVSDFGQRKCSACASCCSVAAILNTFPAVVAEDIAAEILASPAAPIRIFVPAGPERPPRFFLA